MTARARLTVVVLTHNRRDEVTRTLGRLLAPGDAPPVIVVDNGSSDGTAEAVHRAFPQVVLLRLEENRGAAGRNAGIAAATTPYVALCDDDTVWAPGSLDRAADVLDADPELALVTGRVLVGPEGRLDAVCQEMVENPLPPRPGRAGVPVLGFLAGASVARRQAILAAGGFESRLFLGGEEWLLAVDLAAAGWRMAYLDDVVVHHYPSAARDGDGRHALLARNAIWLAWLRRPVPIALAATWRALRLARTRRVRLIAAVLRGLPWVLRQRRCLPADVERCRRRLDGRKNG